MLDEFEEADPFHGLHAHQIYGFSTFFYGGYIRTNISKTRIKDLNDLKTRITQEIQSTKKETVHVVFLEIGKR